MKHLIVIWSLLLTCLAILPCSDTYAAESCGEQAHWHDASAHDHNATEGADYCSPLCSCHCCHVHVTQQQDNNISFIKPYSDTFSEVFLNRYTSPHTALWHPPQV